MILRCMTLWGMREYSSKMMCSVLLYVGGTPMMIICMNLLQYKWTALNWASSRGHTECVKELLERGADVNMQGTVSAV